MVNSQSKGSEKPKKRISRNKDSSCEIRVGQWEDGTWEEGKNGLRIQRGSLGLPLFPSSVAQKQLALNRNFVQNGAAAGAAFLIPSYCLFSHTHTYSVQYCTRLQYRWFWHIATYGQIIWILTNSSISHWGTENIFALSVNNSPLLSLFCVCRRCSVFFTANRNGKNLL